MKEQQTKSKKRIVYYFLLAACVLILAAATVLTVYFVTNGDDVVKNPDDQNTPVTPPDDKDPDGDKDPDKPTGGEATKYVTPVNAAYTLGYNEIYSNGTLGWHYRHYALDFAAEQGTEVCAMTAGTIKQISLSKETGLYSYRARRRVDFLLPIRRACGRAERGRQSGSGRQNRHGCGELRLGSERRRAPSL